MHAKYRVYLCLGEHKKTCMAVTMYYDYAAKQRAEYNAFGTCIFCTDFVGNSVLFVFARE